MRRLNRALILAAAASLTLAGGAQAVVVDMNAVGQTSVAYNPSDQSGYFGVALVPGTQSTLAAPGNGAKAVPVVTSPPPCQDPWLARDLGPLPMDGLCWHGGDPSAGGVLHANETFSLTWDAPFPGATDPQNVQPLTHYWSTTRKYVEQYLKDVADGSGGLGHPYAVTSQYHDAGGRAGNHSVYGGACVDYGVTGGSSCKLGDTTAANHGQDYPASACPITGSSNLAVAADGTLQRSAANRVCLTDAGLRDEATKMVQDMELQNRTQPGTNPVLVLLTPSQVEVCLDAGGRVCSANSNAGTQFCSYHSYLTVAGTRYTYVVQPWTPLTNCDEPDLPAFPLNADVTSQATAAGVRLVSPLSAGHIAAVVNPWLNGWFGTGGAEINDNGCRPLGSSADAVTLGSSGQNPYVLQREFNNGGVLESDPNSLGCTPNVRLSPTFVVPSAVDAGDAVTLDGSTTPSTLMISRHDYVWDFHDGSAAERGGSVVHVFPAPGSYPVKLTVTDRGGNTSSITQIVQVSAPGSAQPGSSLSVSARLLPQSLSAVLRSGLALRITANQPADGVVALSIPAAAARRAHLNAGPGSSVVIARGTVTGIHPGTMTLRVHIARSLAGKLSRLRHLTLSVRLVVVAAGHRRQAVDVAARF